MGKNKKRYFATILVMMLTGYITATVSQNLDSLPQERRDSILISTANEVVLRYGPGYYREYKQPLIERNQIPEKGPTNPTGENIGRILYNVMFLYDKTKELLEKDFAAVIDVWGDTGKPILIYFGNGWGRFIPEGEWESDAVIEQTLYQEVIFPIYDKEHPEKKEPKNIDELKRKGYEEKDGQWAKVTKDVPPNADLLKRKGYEEINGQWSRVRK
jgi:hypothetical protein